VSPEWVLMASGFHVLKAGQIRCCCDVINRGRRAGSSLSLAATMISNKRNNKTRISQERAPIDMSLARYR